MKTIYKRDIPINTWLQEGSNLAPYTSPPISRLTLELATILVLFKMDCNSRAHIRSFLPAGETVRRGQEKRRGRPRTINTIGLKLRQSIKIFKDLGWIEPQELTVTVLDRGALEQFVKANLSNPQYAAMIAAKLKELHFRQRPNIHLPLWSELKAIAEATLG